MAVCERGQKSWCVKREMSDVSREYLTFHVWRLTFDVYRLTFIVSPFTIAHSLLPIHLFPYAFLALCHALITKPVVMMITPSHNMPI